MDVQEVRRAGEQLRDAEAVFTVLKALHSGCEQDLKLKKRQLFEWRCANRRSREHDPEKEELQREISEAKELQEQAWQEFQSAWEDLQSAKQAYLSTLMAYNSAKRRGKEQDPLGVFSLVVHVFGEGEVQIQAAGGPAHLHRHVLSSHFPPQPHTEASASTHYHHHHHHQQLILQSPVQASQTSSSSTTTIITMAILNTLLALVVFVQLSASTPSAQAAKSCERDCDTNVSPICANDGVTYMNACHFDQAHCFNNDLLPSHYGNC